MDIFFADDSQQKKPSRPGMGPLIAAGGIHVPNDAMPALENDLDSLCSEYGFPVGEIFKWSPGKDLWMYDNLKGTTREEFFKRALALARDCSAIALVVIEDRNSQMASRKAKSRDIDLIQLLLERFHNQLVCRQCHGIVIFSQPTGDRGSENKFLASCVETLKSGTDFVKPDRVALSILSSPPRFIRLLQLADVITSCSTAFVAGEDRYSPPVFEEIKTIFAKETSRIGGIGLKLHPDLKYANLYYWLLGDETFWKHGSGITLPWSRMPYSTSPIVK